MGLFGSKPKQSEQKTPIEFKRSTDKAEELPDLDKLLKGQGFPAQFSSPPQPQQPSFQPPKGDFASMLKQTMMQAPPQPILPPPQQPPFMQPPQPQFMQQPFQPQRPAPPQSVQPVEEEPQEEEEIEELVEEETEPQAEVRDKLKSPQSLIRLPGLEDQRIENPVFVRIDKYKDAIKEVRDIRKRISELQASFEKILTIQDKETDLIENLTEAFISLKSLSQHVDKNLFQPQE